MREWLEDPHRRPDRPRGVGRARDGAKLHATWFAILALWAAPTAAQEESRVWLFVDGPYSGAQWANLAMEVAGDRPVTAWPQIAPLDGETVPELVRRYYGYSSILSDAGTVESGTYMATALTLEELVRQANGIVGDGTENYASLSVPSFMVRPREGALEVQSQAWSGALTVFDPYEELYGALALGEPFRAHRSDLGDRAAGLEPYRLPGTTALSLPPDLAQRLAAEGLGRVVLQERATVQLLDPPDHQECRATEAVLGASPYLAAARERVELAGPRLAQAASRTPLALVDFDFDGGHGELVRAVVRWLLSELGAEALDEHVVEVELNPSQSSTVGDIRTVLDRYAEGYPRVNLERLSDAAAWVVLEDPGIGEAVYEVPPTWLQAVIWEQLQAGRWLNLSWRIVGPSDPLPGGLNELLQDSNSFITVAAGNEAQPLNPESKPQHRAALYRQFVNVTLGDQSQVSGARTNQDGPRVDLVAMGCGFSEPPLTRRHSGSSLAAPIVATSAWLLHLLEGIAAQDVRNRLTGSSSLPSGAQLQVASGGFFDPARAIAGVGTSHVVEADGSLTMLTSVQLDAPDCVPPASAASPVTVEVVPSEPRGISVRQLRGREVTIAVGCVPTSFNLEAQREDGTALLATDLRSFAALATRLVVRR